MQVLTVLPCITLMLAVLGHTHAIYVHDRTNSTTADASEIELTDSLVPLIPNKNIIGNDNIKTRAHDKDIRTKKSSRILNLFQPHSSVNDNQSSNVGEMLHCESRVAWRDLGPLHYPRFLREVHCHRRSRTCMSGYFRCMPVLYTVDVLSEKAEEDQIDPTVPISLRVQWTFRTVETSVGCLCGL